MGPRVRGLRRRGSTLSRESRRSQRQKTASTEANTDINTDVPSSVEAPNEIPDDEMTDDLESNDAADSDADADADADAIDENAHDSNFDLRDAEHERQESPSSTSRAPETMIPDRRPGWWPSRYAPQNPDDRNCVSGMSSVLKKWAELKRDPEELWKEDDPPGVMIEAIRKHTSKHVVTQRVFMRAKKMIRELYPQAPLVTPRGRLGRATGNHNPDGIAPAERLESPGPGPGPGSKADGVSGLTQGPSHGSGSESKNLAINPSEVLLGAPADELSIVEVDSNATFALPHTDSLEHTTSQLRTNMMLKSIDLQRCVTVFHRDADWHTFDPGFPFHGSVISANKKWPRNLAFFCYESKHWSLCHLDTANGLLHHYNSLKHTEMPVDQVKIWIEKNLKLEGGVKVRVVEEDCPQQSDGVNCGVFSLAILESLLSNTDIPSSVEASDFRESLAARIEATIDPKSSGERDTGDPMVEGQDVVLGTPLVMSSLPLMTNGLSPLHEPLDPSLFDSLEDFLDHHSSHNNAGVLEDDLERHDSFCSPNHASTGLEHFESSHHLSDSSSGQEASVLTEGQAPPSIFLPPLVVTENNAAVGHFQAFLESRKRMQDGVKELERTVSTRKDHILQLDLEREALRKELRQEEDALQELSKELAGVDSTDTTDREVREWLEQCPKGAGFEQKFMSKLASHARSTLDEMAEEGRSLRARMVEIEPSCQRHREEIASLTRTIESESQHRQMLEDDLGQ
ncbi:hypothetical protein CEP52_012874 [Fusarium oligoseptatum]|uniref:Ubiquitin-like protease family profile domain-containing protein n=1 Tax=Fusarium oligoseptatum TaxID=2604345 RepID=A0A428SW79_9HYPO|nr:hypothetical protein CEP52_012874 [Fusarium oligoseptatum]